MSEDVHARLSRRGFLTVSAGAGLMAALAACAPREDGKPSIGGNSTGGGTSTGFGGATDWKKFSGTTLSLLLCEHWWTAAVKEKFSQFEDLTGITLKANTLSEDSYYQQALVALSSGSSTYDAIMVGNLQAGQYMKAGWLAPLDQYFRSGGLIDTDWFDVDDFFQPSQQAGSSGGELLALPISAEAGVVMYRRSALESAGISGFASQESLLDASKALQGGSFQKPFAGRGRRGLDIVWVWTNFFLTAGGEFFDGNTPVVDSEAGIAATELYVEQLLKQYGPSGASNMSWLEATGQMNEGNAAILTDASGLLSVVLDPSKSQHTADVAVSRWPGETAAPNYWYWLAGIPKNAANKDAAALFYAWAMSPEVAAEISGQSGSPSARQSVWKDDRFLSFYPEDTAVEISANLAAVQPDRVPYARPTFPEEADALGLELVNVLTEGKDIRKALSDAAAGMAKASQ